ncbi:MULTISPECIES: hypothetical protein [Streptomyces]|uniref:Uncharacterized protein n=1 Tax=Streptomyces lonarensis TaxID=700599 RepID=A0A7X6CZU6_9ACTN|nr:hypothetical protein [Streptomyces lonarensis]NJQ05500.1 hypothetical protein [Streptomyces lonarensis]
MTSSTLTIGGLAVSLAIVGVWLTIWLRKGKDPKGIAPFAGGLALGALAIACAGGLLGWLGGAAGAGVNTVGGFAAGSATGGADGAVAAAANAGLTPGGAIVVVVAFAIGAFVAKAANKGTTWQILFGFVAGAAMALTAGGAGLLDSTLYTAANTVGDMVLSAFNGGS